MNLARVVNFNVKPRKAVRQHWSSQAGSLVQIVYISYIFAGIRGRRLLLKDLTGQAMSWMLCKRSMSALAARPSVFMVSIIPQEGSVLSARLVVHRQRWPGYKNPLFDLHPGS